MAPTQSLAALKRKIQRLQTQAEKLEKGEKPGIKQLRAVLKKFRLTSADMRLALKGTSRRRRRSKLRGRKIKPKYRNPDQRSQTWTGRGRMPVWMAALVTKGKKPDEFLIKTA